MIYLAKIRPCRVPVKRPDGRTVLVRVFLGCSGHLMPCRLRYRATAAAQLLTRPLLPPATQDFPDEAARQAFRERCTTTVAGNCLQGARCALFVCRTCALWHPAHSVLTSSLPAVGCTHRATCSLKAMDECRGPGWLRWLGWKPRECLPAGTQQFERPGQGSGTDVRPVCVCPPTLQASHGLRSRRVRRQPCR